MDQNASLWAAFDVDKYAAKFSRRFEEAGLDFAAIPKQSGASSEDQQFNAYSDKEKEIDEDNDLIDEVFVKDGEKSADVLGQFFPPGTVPRPPDETVLGKIAITVFRTSFHVLRKPFAAFDPKIVGTALYAMKVKSVTWTLMCLGSNSASVRARLAENVEFLNILVGILAIYVKTFLSVDNDNGTVDRFLLAVTQVLFNGCMIILHAGIQKPQPFAAELDRKWQRNERDV